MLRVEDHTLAASPEVFRGFIRARTPGKDPLHPTLSIIADDLTSLLDDAFVPVELRQPETMQARIGFFWGQYAGRFLSGDLSFVASVGSTLPIQRFEAVSLRQAIEMTIAQASSTADYYVDMLGRLHVFVTETNNAPFAIDADAPGGGEIAPETMAVEFDSNQYANRVYVKGATPEASLFVQDEASIAAANGLVRTVVVQSSDVTTAAMAQAMGTMYLGRVKDATPRGSFRTHSPNDGWRGGQNVTVTSADHNITAQTYRIARVTTRVLGGLVAGRCSRAVHPALHPERDLQLRLLRSAAWPGRPDRRHDQPAALLVQGSRGRNGRPLPLARGFGCGERTTTARGDHDRHRDRYLVYDPASPDPRQRGADHRLPRPCLRPQHRRHGQRQPSRPTEGWI
jgi:hypothetical protein